jgi:hypothetical protein
MVEINAGRVLIDLIMRSAGFQRELVKNTSAMRTATTRMSGDVQKMQSGFASAAKTIKGVFAGLVTVATVRSLVNVGQAAIKSASEIQRSSDRMGVSAEQIQRLGFAASKADIDFNTLTSAFAAFQKQLATGKVAAEGDTILDKFLNFMQELEDAPTKMDEQRLAIQGFGKQWQSAMAIASKGVQEFKDDMDAAKVASDEMIARGARLEASSKDFSNAITAGFQQGFFSAFAGELKTSEETLTAVNEAGKRFGELLGWVTGLIAVIIKAVGDFIGVLKELDGWVSSGNNEVAQFWTDVNTEINKANASIEAYFRELMSSAGLMDKLPKATTLTPLAPDTTLTDVKPPQIPVTTVDKPFGEGRDLAKEAADAARLAREEMSHFNDVQEKGLRLWEETLSPLQAHQYEMNKIKALYEEGAVSADTYFQMQSRGLANVAGEWLGLAGTAVGALGQIFGENKAFAIAEAVINTAAAIMKTYAQYGFTPFGIAAAATQALVGAAQIATIASTQPGSSKKPKSGGGSVSGGGGKAKRAEETVGSTSKSGPQQSVTLVIKGDVFGPEHFRKMVKGINGVVQDGTVLLRVT